MQRGPQGTLGGQDSETGVIRYVLNEPNLSGFEARAGADVSTMRHASQPGSSFQGMVNVPIIDDVLAVRASGYDTYIPGFIDNAYNGTQDVNVQRRYGGRITALWRPAELALSEGDCALEPDRGGFERSGPVDRHRRRAGRRRCQYRPGLEYLGSVHAGLRLPAIL